MNSKYVFETELVGHVSVGSGHIEIGDLDEVQVMVPTRCGDGVYSINAVKINGEVRGYFIGADLLEEWAITGMEGTDRGWPAVLVKAAKKKKSVKKAA